ncbi:Abi-alpha family protein [Gibbsiella quercinecans]|uniref:Abi-alpha family protein n=1 Tax=Gibbsiella quercinecans TaxID=929813 RepID=UPI00242AE034|nr:Abi-alpha family protein [Gibbsiella quercinecans]
MDKEMMDLIKSVPKDVWVQLYNDAPRPMLQQFGKLGEHIVKTLRLVTLPIQCTAYFQDKIDRGFAKALKSIPEERRTIPPEGLSLEIAEKLKYHDCDTLIGDLYVDLLSASMDKEKSRQAHPAFLPIIGQLSSDEAFFLLRLSENRPSVYVRKKDNWDLVRKEDRDSLLKDVVFNIDGVKIKLVDLALKPEEYYYPENLYIYIEHLNKLGLLEYSNTYSNENSNEWRKFRSGEYDMWFVQQTKFGRMFFECCNKTLSKVGF